MARNIYEMTKGERHEFDRKLQQADKGEVYCIVEADYKPGLEQKRLRRALLQTGCYAVGMFSGGKYVCHKPVRVRPEKVFSAIAPHVTSCRVVGLTHRQILHGKGPTAQQTANALRK